MRNLKLTLEYDGTNYVGWQRQLNGPSIQGEIESAVRQILQQDVAVIGAGRTDAGVHARRQVANVNIESSFPVAEVKSALNALLPDDIVIHEVEEVNNEFHARYSAKQRIYFYRIAERQTALMRNFSWFVKYRLDRDVMKQAASLIVGTHDFESFCRAQADVDNHLCTISSACWEEDGDFLLFTISADRFLHGMVRALVGTMVDLGRGYTPIDEFTKILEKKNRSEVGMAAPAKGLTLEKIIY